MSGRRWRMSVYDLEAGAVFAVAEGTQAFVYAAGAEATVAAGGAVETVPPGEGAFAGAGATVRAAGPVWLYEVAPEAAAVREAPGLSAVLSRIAETGEGEHILRADRVEAPAGARTPAHRHRGPGIRRMERGLVRAELGEALERVGAGGAWFESGRETVVGTNISGGTNVFIRVMLLPAELAGGRSSFLPASPDEAAKPRAVALRLFGERPAG